jgi:hypothetical protein
MYYIKIIKRSRYMGNGEYVGGSEVPRNWYVDPRDAGVQGASAEHRRERNSSLDDLRRRKAAREAMKEVTIDLEDRRFGTTSR